MSDHPAISQLAFSGDPHVLTLIRRMVETEAELRALLGDNVDLVLDPTTGTPIFFRETQQALLCAQEELRQANDTLEQRVEERTAEVQQRERLLDATINSMADGLIIYDADGHILHMSPTASTMLGVGAEVFTREEVQQAMQVRWVTADGVTLPPEAFPATRALRGETVHGEVLSFENAARTVWVSISAAPISAADGSLQGAVVNFADITALHNLQEQMRTMLQIVSHDLRSPITVMHGHVGLLRDLLDRQQIDGAVRGSVEAIGRSEQRMNMMIEDLVDVTRFEGGQLRLEQQPVIFHSFLEDYLKRMETAIAVDRVVTQLPPDLPAMFVDFNRLDRIMTNLLTNAMKYSDGPVCISATQQGDQVVVSISDQGRGIDPVDLPHLFERFHRVKGERKAEGIGLGLYITKLLVEAHGGRIWVESVKGHGATFYFTLPVAG